MTDRFSQFTTYLVPAAAVLLGLALGLLARRTVLRRLAHLAARSTWKYDDALVEALRGPVVAWFALAGLYAAMELLALPAATEGVLGRLLLVLAILSVTWAAARFVVRALRAGASEGALPGVSLIANVAASAVYVLGALVVLDKLGISITPIITALGVGGLAVALALQDTLANLFAGLRILAAGKIRPGDFVRLETGQEGYVQDITWAQTTLRQLQNNLVVVPNARLAGAITTNFHLPAPPQAVSVVVSVPYGSDLARVEAIALDVARGVQREVDGAMREFSPAVRFHTFAESAIQANVALQASDFEARFLVVHEFVKRLDARLRAEGVAAPYPVRTVHLRQPGG